MPESTLARAIEDASEPPPLDILIVDDSEEDRALYRRLLIRGFNREIRIRESATAVDGLVAYRQSRPDCLLLDYRLPDMDGIEFLYALHASDQEHRPTVVMLTGEGNERLAVEAIREGAQDYLDKSQVTQELLRVATLGAIDRSQLERELLESQRAEAEMKDRLLSHVSHELRTPLTSIFQFVSILEDETAGPLNEQQAEFVRLALQNARQLKGMVEDLLFLSRLDNGKVSIEKSRVVIGRLVDDVTTAHTPIAREKKIEITARVAEGTSDCLVDRKRVRQILINLIDNATKFTDPGGTISIGVGPAVDPGFVLIEITDTGCGFSSDHAARIFDHMYQVAPGSQGSRDGLGIGLRICRDLVTRHGGQIWAESELDVGSRFFFTLPAFSIAKPLEAVVADVPASLALMRVIVRPGRPEGLTPSDFESARRALERCLMPDRDVLLPAGISDRPHDLWAVAQVDAKRADIVASRITRVLSGPAGLGPKVEISVSLDALPVPDASTVKERATELARGVLVEVERRSGVTAVPSAA